MRDSDSCRCPLLHDLHGEQGPQLVLAHVRMGEDPVAVLIVVRVLHAVKDVSKITKLDGREEARKVVFFSPVKRFHSNLLADLDAVSRKRHALNAIYVVR